MAKARSTMTGVRSFLIAVVLLFSSMGALHVITVSCEAQLYIGKVPGSAHANLYFPQFADGGPVASQWQTTFTFGLVYKPVDFAF